MMLSPEAVVLHYRIVRAIGSGGMGVVYEADDTRLGRRVALKFLPPQLARDHEALERFQREARAASALNHPNICTVYAIEAADGTPFIAMELLEGGSLDRVIADRPLSWNALVDTGIQIADALDAAHRRGIIHRDIKPANLFLTTDGRAKILDFGIAKIAGPTAGQVDTIGLNTAPQPLTGAGVTVGTVAYMSPEQARGEELDARSDLFSLAAVLYEMCTGRRAFEGNTSGVVFQKLLDGTVPEAPRAHNPTLPFALEQVILKGLEKDRELRYQTSADLRGDLKRLKRDASSGRLAFVPPAPTGAAAPVSSRAVLLAEARRHKSLAGAAMLAVLGLTAAAAYGIYALTRPAPPVSAQAADRTQRMTVTRLTTSGDVSGCGDISPDGKYVVYCEFGGRLKVRQVATGSTIDLADFTGATTFSRDGDFVFVTSLSDLYPHGALWSVPTLGGEPRRIISEIFGAVAVSPDGKRIAFTRNPVGTRETVLFTADIAGGNERRLAVGSLDETWFADAGVSWSPDGRRLALMQMTIVGGYKERPVLVDVASGKVEPLGAATWIDLGRPVWLPDGSGLLFPSRERSEGPFQFWIAQYPGGHAVRITNDVRGFGKMSVGVTADGSTIATIPWDIVSNIWSTNGDATAPLEQWTSGVRIDGSSGMAAPADSRLVFASADGIDVGIWSVDAPGARLRKLTREYAEVPSTPDDGRFIAYQAIHEGRFRIWRMQRDGSDARVLSRGEDDIEPLASPDGHWIFYTAAGTPSGLMRMPAEGGDAVRLTARPFLSLADISDDSREILVRIDNPSNDKSSAATHLVLDAQTGATRAQLIVPGGHGTRARFGRQSGLILYAGEKDGVHNLWEQPAGGGTPRQLTHFTSGRIYNFAYAAGRKRLFIARGQRTGDVVLIRNFR